MFAERIGPVCRPDLAARLTGAAGVSQVALLHTDTRPEAWDDWRRITGMKAEPASAADPGALLPDPPGRLGRRRGRHRPVCRRPRRPGARATRRTLRFRPRRHQLLPPQPSITRARRTRPPVDGLAAGQDEPARERFRTGITSGPPRAGPVLPQARCELGDIDACPTSTRRSPPATSWASRRSVDGSNPTLHRPVGRGGEGFCRRLRVPEVAGGGVVVARTAMEPPHQAPFQSPVMGPFVWNDADRTAATSTSCDLLRPLTTRTDAGQQAARAGFSRVTPWSASLLGRETSRRCHSADRCNAWTRRR